MHTDQHEIKRMEKKTIKLLLAMLRGHAQMECHCKDGELTESLKNDYRRMAADLIEELVAKVLSSILRGGPAQSDFTW